MLKIGNRAIFRYAKFKYKPDFSESKFTEAPEVCNKVAGTCAYEGANKKGEQE
jgi:hypothetical protein